MKTSLAALARINFALLLVSATGTVRAGSATWNLNPSNGDWNTATNWMPATVPDGPSDTATFDVSNTTDIDLNYNDGANGFEVSGLMFNASASPFTFSVSSSASLNFVLTVSGLGITNDSGIAQSFVTLSSFLCCDSAGVIQFTNSATAGDLTVFTNSGFFTATKFFDTSTADNATLIANKHGVISFLDDSTGATARVKVAGTGSLDISAHNPTGVTVGLIEGDGTVILGANNLTVGSNDRNMVFSGMIQDAGGGVRSRKSD